MIQPSDFGGVEAGIIDLNHCRLQLLRTLQLDRELYCLSACCKSPVKHRKVFAEAATTDEDFGRFLEIKIIHDCDMVLPVSEYTLVDRQKIDVVPIRGATLLAVRRTKWWASGSRLKPAVVL